MPFKQRQTFRNYRRIRSGEEFRLALAANFYRNKWFVIYARENRAGSSRLGMIVSKKVVHHSVNRNFAKRLIRETFRQDFPTDCALDIVVRLRRPLSQEISHEGRRTLAQLLGDIQRDASAFN